MTVVSSFAPTAWPDSTAAASPVAQTGQEGEVDDLDGDLVRRHLRLGQQRESAW
jgi:hypothetical protein